MDYRKIENALKALKEGKGDCGGFETLWNDRNID